MNATRVLTTIIDTPVGQVLAGATAEGICLAEYSEPHRLDAQCATLRRHFGGPVERGRHEYLDQLEQELNDYFAGRLKQFQVPLLYPGSPFQQRVWDRLRQIPYGETRSYEQIATELDAPLSTRAVGTANGQNRIAIVIPCHRVINKSGRLGGYGGGLERKRFLLNLESGISVEPRP